jgi:hypothetical protein
MRFNRVVVVTMFLALVGLFLGSSPAWSQATVGSGGIQGTVTDPQGAVVANAKVTITKKDSGQSAEVTTTSAGTYSSAALTPGTYVVRVEAANFKSSEVTFTVQIGVISNGDIRLELGASSSTVEVTSSTVTVNTEQVQVEGTVTAEQIDNLPVNGRNFLDLAQLEPGVQIQDGSNFDPTKTGFSSISFGGRFGRTARIEVDGVDVSDETVGTTTTSIPEGAIDEFQISQSTLDLSNELSSSGAVNVATKSGTDTWHGQGFGTFRDSSEGAALLSDGKYQRSQYGGDVGSAIIKDKLFFFADGERTLQHSALGLSFPEPFTSYNGNFNSPYRENNLLGKIDWNITKSIHAFYRYDYFDNSLVPPFGVPSYSFFANKDWTNVHAAGIDFTTGSFTHSFRFEYLKFTNKITDAVRGSGTPFADFPVEMLFANNGFATGPSDDAPQNTLQSDHQVKYDGSKVWGSHTIRYGMAFNHIQGGGFASFFGFAPLVENLQIASSGYNSFDAAAGFTCPAGQTADACPLNYLPDFTLIGNGLGCGSEHPAFGRPCGGNGPDNRLGLYVGDTWKVRPDLTFIYGVRYSRDSGRTDSDLDTIEVLNEYLPGDGNRVKQQNADFGPQIGFAWNIHGDGKTVIRSGVGIFYENAIFNNVLFDRPARLPSGAFFTDQIICELGTGAPVPFADGNSYALPGTITGQGTNSTCNTPLGATLPVGTSEVIAGTPLDCSGITVAACIAAFQGAYQAVAKANPTGPNPSFIPNQIAGGSEVSGGGGTFGPNYKVPRSVQMNIGIQREIKPGMMLSADFLRNVGTHYLLDIDANHTGDAAYLNVPNAQAAISATNASFGCGANFTAAATNCAIGAGATIDDFANNGLDSVVDQTSGNQCSACSFAGINPLIGETPLLEPVGRSVYNALDIKWQDNVRNPFPGVHYLNFQASYTLSRFVNSGSSNSLFAAGTPGASDQDFIDNSLDNRNPLRYMGPDTLDRTHQFNFGGWGELPGGFRLGILSHFWSPLAVTPLINAVSGSGEIYRSDLTGDGTIGDPLAIAQTSSSCGAMGGTCDYKTYNVGAYGRSLGPKSLANAINNFNNNIAGKTITPAGQSLVNAGLMTEAQLLALGATPQSIIAPPSDEAGLAWMKAFDLQIAYHHSFFNERLKITPSVGITNLFNFANFDVPLSILSGGLSGNPGAINGQSNSQNPLTGRQDRVQPGTGVFGLGAPRAIEWGMKFDF